MQPSRRQGFTLIELSVVLVIIGLITAGILGGRELLRNSEINSIMTDSLRYRAALQSFKLKFNGYPGDITNATTLFPSAGVANGDGDGLIYAANASENYGAMQQLAVAGMIPGSFSGTSTGGASVLNVNTPEARIKGTGWGISSSSPTPVNAVTLLTANRLYYGGVQSSWIPTAATAIKPDEAASLDRKSDDGLPNGGKILSGANSGSSTASTTTCVTTNTATAAYNVTLNSPVCAMVFDAE